ncbi:Dolichyl-phosphate-mannose-protein mannosyltransferase [Symmachiella dynata]|uniref:Dolichyl-phosphate-mannose-protein mannosyltransferase n=1 Tax=Symmachiella dynata TaxID=2527995 RepID=A0A517ZU29_9PLAN|nr:phospholipid carrier-dependent glycosyltransferase [Symmachiella dynata]QDU45986.1 Dolichyl-phosphate-mannose-protein mannosyltransferase [Symmachiella dynata]
MKLNPSTSLVSALPAIIIAFAFFGYFYNKAFAIDDPYFLFQAQHVLTDPWHPSSFDIAWNDRFDRASILSPTGPMMAYILVPTVLADGAEWVAHLTVTLFLCWSAYSMVRIALLLGFSRNEALVSSLMLVATPTVIAMSSTAMPDIPGLAFALAGLERWLAFQAHQKWHQAFLAFVFLSLAVLTRSHTAGIVGICALTLVLPLKGQIAKRSVWWLSVAALAAIPAAVLVVSWVTGDTAAETNNLAQTTSFLNLRSASSNFLAFCGHFTLALPLAVPWLLMRGKQLFRWQTLVALLPTTLICWVTLMPWWVFVMAGLGAVSLVDILYDACQRRDALRILLGLWLLITLPICLYIHMPSKYLVLSVPALALLLILESRHYSRSIRRAGLGVWLAGSLLLGFLIIDFDASRTDFGRRAARELVATKPLEGSVWYGGHWGFQWYAEKAGAKSVLSPAFQPRKGDSIVCSETFFIQTAKYHCRAISLLEETQPGGQVMSNGAGFYSNYFGYLPISWGRGDYERFHVLVVTDPGTRW